MEPFIKLGTLVHYSTSGIFGMPVEDRRRHMLISGKSGSGKSTLLANIFLQEANSGRGCLLLDPHGELAQLCLTLVPPRRINKTIYFNPSDIEHPIGFNVLDGVSVEQRPARTAHIVAAFRSLFGSSWGPRLEHMLYNTIAALLEVPGTTLLGVPRMLLNSTYRTKILAQVTDPYVRQYWELEFPGLEKKFGQEAMSPVLNKVGQFLNSPVVRNIVGQPKSAFSARHIIDNNYLVIANLSKGVLGDSHANILGALLITTFGNAAMTRADLPEHQRKDFALIIDEFPNYATTAFTTLLSEARKYRLSLTLAHQYLDQMDHDVRAAVLGNVGSLITFRVGSQDAQTFARELDDVEPHQLTATPNHQAWSRILRHGEPYGTRLLQTPLPPEPHGHHDKIVAYSRMHFGSSRQAIEERINRFLNGPNRSRKQIHRDERQSYFRSAPDHDTDVSIDAPQW